MGEAFSHVRKGPQVAAMSGSVSITILLPLDCRMVTAASNKMSRFKALGVRKSPLAAKEARNLRNLCHELLRTEIVKLNQASDSPEGILKACIARLHLQGF
jgi:hypothetical protein